MEGDGVTNLKTPLVKIFIPNARNSQLLKGKKGILFYSFTHLFVHSPSLPSLHSVFAADMH